MHNFVQELRWRGMLNQLMPQTEEKLLQGPVAGYIGFDPTADSLHVGHLVQVYTLMHFQRAGHKPVALVGGATGMVGDPSGKSAERNLLGQTELEHNVRALEQQLRRFLNFDTGENAAIMVNNADWFSQMNLFSFLRDTGKHITVNYMLAKESVKRRLESESGISFTEFCYQLIQGYDFLHLYQHHNCQVQMGGSDQWGNIVTGTELIRRKASGTAYAITTNLIKKSDGTKFGKTEGGAVWLSREKTSPYKFYQFWLNATDDDAREWIKIFTFRSQADIEQLIADHDAQPHLRLLQRALAQDVTALVHSQHDVEIAEQTAGFLFSNTDVGFLNDFTPDQIAEVFEGVPTFTIPLEVIQQGTDLLSLVAQHTPVFASKGEAKKLIQSGGVLLNKQKAANPAQAITINDLVAGQYLIVQKGKKNYNLIRVTQ